MCVLMCAWVKEVLRHLPASVGIVPVVTSPPEANVLRGLIDSRVIPEPVRWETGHAHGKPRQ